jgi:hypothetical protein
MTIFRFLLLLTVVGAYARAQNVDSHYGERTSILALIAAPEKHDGMRVQLVGFLNIEFEGNSLYLDQNSFEHLIFKNGLWLVLTEHEIEKYRSLSGKYVIITGTFDAKDQGHRGNWSGSLKQLTEIRPMPTRSEIEQSLK